MKYLKIIFLLFIVVVNSYGQSLCPPNGISTNPTNPVNNLTPLKKNTFDWRTERYNFNYKNGRVYNMESPFYNSYASSPHAIKLVLIKDMKVEDGWELIRRDLGYDDDNVTKSITDVQYPVVLLYNKYTGLLRMFTAAKFEDLNNGVFSSMSFEVKMAGFATSTFTSIDSPVLEYNNLMLPAAKSTFNGSDFRWFYADFQTNYDPCTCLQTSQIYINLYPIQTANVQLSGSLTGTVTSIGATSSDDEKKWSFSKDNLINSVEKGKQTYESIEAFKNQEFAKLEGAYQKTTSSISSQLLSFFGSQLATKKEDKKKEVESFTKLLSKSGFLKEGLKAAPVIGAGVSFLTSFIAGGNESAPDPQKVEIMPMAINAEIKLSGTITTVPQAKITSTFATPGSLPNANYLGNWYPYYNETLGILNILEKPDVTNTVRTRAYGKNPDFCKLENYYQLNKAIDFVVNPAAGFKPNPEVQVAYVFEYGDATDVNINILNGLVEKRYASYLEVEGIASLRTPYIPIRLLPDYVAVADLNSGTYSPNTQPGLCQQVATPRKVYLKFLINLERKDATAKTQNVLYVVKYEVNLVNYSTTKFISSPMPATTGPYLNNQYWIPVRNGYTYQLYDKVTIQQKIIPLASNIVKIQSGEIIVEIPQITSLGDMILDSSLGGEVVLESMSNLETASQGRVISFCNDAKYKEDVSRQSKTVSSPTKGDTKTDIPTSSPKATQLLSVYPNPTTGEATITYEVDKEGSSVAIYLTNNLGIRVMEVSNEVSQAQGTRNVRIDTRSLAAGVYFYTLVLNGVAHTERLVVIK